MTAYINAINDFAAQWATTMGTAVWQSTALAAAIFALTLSIRRLSPSLRYWLWMLVVFRLLVVPLGTISLPLLPATPSPLEPSVSPSFGPLAAGPGSDAYGAGSGFGGNVALYDRPAPSVPQRSPLPSAPTVVPRLSLFAVLLTGWMLGIAIAFARLGITWFRTRRIVSNLAEPAGESLSNLAVRLARQMGLRRTPRIGVAELRVSPFVFGVVRPVIVLPRRLVDHADSGQLAAVLAHEMAHLRRSDPLFGWVFSLCHSVYFFHPILILLKRQVLIEREKACDDCALSASRAKPSTYARALVTMAKLCSRTPTPAGALLVVGESFADLKSRITALERGTRPQARMSAGAVALLVALAALTVPGIALTNREPGTRQHLATADKGVSSVAQASPAPVVSTQPVPPVRTGGRVLHFPVNRALGTVRIMDSDFTRTLDTFYYWLDDAEWVDWSAARGDVVIPEGKRVWLVLNPRMCDDLSGLSELRADDIYKLSVDYTERGAPSMDDTGMAQVAHLTGLRYLNLRWSNVTDAGLVFLSAFYRLERLQVPRLMTDAGMAHIGRVRWLKALYFAEAPITDAGLAYLERIPRLRELAIGGSYVTDAGLAYLAHLPELDFLMLGGPYFTDYGMAQLRAVLSLRILNVSRLNVSDSGVQQIAALPNLEVLSLYGIPALTNISLAYLGESRTLRKLDLSVPVGETSRMGDEGFAFLANCPHLEHLSLPPTFTDAGLVHVAKMKHLKYLRATNSSRSLALTDTGLRSIAELPALEELSITGGDGITDAGLACLGRMHTLKSLALMSDSRNMTDAGIAELAKLSELTSLDLYMTPKYCPVTVSGLNYLNALTNLTFLSIYGGRQDGSVLDLSALYELENLTIAIPDLRDEDVAFVADLVNLKWLQGIRGVSDEGMAYVAGLRRLERLNIGGPGVTDEGLRHLRGLKVMNMLYVEGNFTDDGLRHLEALQLLRDVGFEGRNTFTQNGLKRFVTALPQLARINQQPVNRQG